MSMEKNKSLSKNNSDLFFLSTLKNHTLESFSSRSSTMGFIFGEHELKS